MNEGTCAALPVSSFSSHPTTCASDGAFPSAEHAAVICSEENPIGNSLLQSLNVGGSNVRAKSLGICRGRRTHATSGGHKSLGVCRGQRTHATSGGHATRCVGTWRRTSCRRFEDRLIRQERYIVALLSLQLPAARHHRCLLVCARRRCLCLLLRLPHRALIARFSFPVRQL